MAKRPDYSKVKIEWIEDPRVIIPRLQRAVRNKINRKAVRKASSMLAKEVKRLAPKDKSKSPEGYPGGALKKVTGVKVYVPKKNKDIVVGVVGARSKFTAILPGVVSRGPKKGKQRLRKPSKYQHMVNRGHKKRGGGFVLGRNYLESALNNTWPAMDNAMKNIIGIGIINELA